MDDMRELVSIEAVERLFLALALVGPIVGALVGAAIGLRCRSVKGWTWRGLAIGMLGVANWVLWRMYNALTDHYGLDSVKNLLINLAIFSVIGLSAGLAYGFIARRKRESASSDDAETGAGGVHG